MRNYNASAGVLVLVLHCTCVQVGASSGEGLSKACWMMGASGKGCKAKKCHTSQLFNFAQFLEQMLGQDYEAIFLFASAYLTVSKDQCI